MLSAGLKTGRIGLSHLLVGSRNAAVLLRLASHQSCMLNGVLSGELRQRPEQARGLAGPMMAGETARIDVRAVLGVLCKERVTRGQKVDL